MINLGPAGGYMNYGLFRDVGRSAVWGFSPGVDTMGQTLSIPNRGSATATFNIYGRIPALQDVPVGSYTDSVTVTVSP
jgi:spore coat protein U-like protein